MAKKAEHPVPKTIEEADAFLVKVREAQRALAAINTECDSQVGELETAFTVVKLAHDEEVEALRRLAQEQTAPFQKDLNALAAGLREFARRNRSSLFQRGEQSVKLRNGVLRWFSTPNPPRVSTGKTKHAVIIAWLKAQGQEMAEKYVRVKETLNKQSLRDTRPVVPGVKYVQDHKFGIQIVSDTPEGQEAFQEIELPA